MASKSPARQKRAGAPAPELAPPATRGRRRRLASATPCCIPIVNGAHQIVGWTDAAPAIERGCLRHGGAERLLRGPIFCTQVALTRSADIARAGGPADWPGPWRCLALCPLEHARGLDQPGDVPRVSYAQGNGAG